MADRLAVHGGTPIRTTPLWYAKGLSTFGDDERKAVLDVLESRSLFRYYGPSLIGTVSRFEAELCEVTGAAHAVAVSSGTAALRVALAALGVGCGDEVIVPAVTFIATVNAVVLAGAVPVFAEGDATLGLDVSDVAAKMSPRTRAVIAVHLENVVSDMPALLAVTGDVPVVEDAAQALGASFGGRSAGTFGAIGTFSLQLEKNITTGEGGALITNDTSLFTRAARYQDQGGQFTTSHGGSRGGELDEPFVGENLRMTEIAGAIAEVQLHKLPQIVAAMRSNKAHVLNAVGHIDGMERRHVPDVGGDGSSSITWYLPDASAASAFVEAIVAEGIPAARLYDGLPVYATPSVLAQRTATNKGGPWHCAEHPTNVVYEMGMCPRSEAFIGGSVTVGIGANYSSGDCDDVARAVRRVAAHVLT
jgi:8-amino-3,8-dideoxy-alpha-D-manno-octulosonate transaminase